MYIMHAELPLDLTAVLLSAVVMTDQSPAESLTVNWQCTMSTTVACVTQLGTSFKAQLPSCKRASRFCNQLCNHAAWVCHLTSTQLHDNCPPAAFCDTKQLNSAQKKN
ncbi:TPA: hypothetical protein ACH3X2_003160 [Trebouxia sp. C0005]